MYQLATALDLNGKPTEASRWYGQLMKDFPKTEVGERATGSLRRLQMKGRPLVLAGTGLTGGSIDVAQYRGKTLIVVYWATWCKPCTEDLPALKELYAANRAAGLEVLGVNVDNADGPIKEYIAEYKVPGRMLRRRRGWIVRRRSITGSCRCRRCSWSIRRGRCSWSPPRWTTSRRFSRTF